MRLTCLVLAALCAFVGGCPKKHAPAPTQAPASVAPPRIVALSPAVAVMLRDLGYERDIVGRHTYDLVLDPSTPVCGDQAGIDYESLVKLRPTHVFTQWGSRDLPERLATLAAAHGWIVKDVPILALDDVSHAVGTLDRTLRGVAEHAEVSPVAKQLQGSMNNLLHAPESARKDHSGIGPVLILISTAPPSALGPGSAHHELLTALGAMQALANNAPAYVELTHEDLVRLNPGAVMLFLPRSSRGTASGGTEAGATPGDDPWKPLRPLGIRALESGRITIIDDPLGLLPSTGMIGVGEKMRTALEAWDTE